MNVIDLSGSPRTMGEAFGELLRSEIHELYEIRLRSALLQAHEHGRGSAKEQDLLAIARASLRITGDHDPSSAAELAGIARGAGLTVEQTMAMNGLTDLRDALAWWEDGERFGGCTSVVVPGPVARGGELLCGQTWDLGTDNMPFVRAVRRAPSGGPRSVCLTIAGCLPFLGVNDAGLAVGTTNLRTRDARPGVIYVTLIDRALRARSVAEAVASMTPLPRAGGHYFYLADASGHAAGLECTATLHHRTDIAASVFVHTNHCLVPAHEGLDVDGSNASSRGRLQRMSVLTDGSAVVLDAQALRAFFSDMSGGAVAICRDDPDGTSTNAAAIIEPRSRTLLACHGLPSRASWVELCV